MVRQACKRRCRESARLGLCTAVERAVACATRALLQELELMRCAQPAIAPRAHAVTAQQHCSAKRFARSRTRSGRCGKPAEAWPRHQAHFATQPARQLPPQPSQLASAFRHACLPGRRRHRRCSRGGRAAAATPPARVPCCPGAQPRPSRAACACGCPHPAAGPRLPTPLLLPQADAAGRALPREPVPAALVARQALTDAAAESAAAAAGGAVLDCLEACCWHDDLHLFLWAPGWRLPVIRLPNSCAVCPLPRSRTFAPHPRRCRPAGPARSLLTWARLPLPLLYEGSQVGRGVGGSVPLLWSVPLRRLEPFALRILCSAG